MKKIKYIMWLIIIALIGIIIYQNQEYFLARQSLGINLWIGEPYQTPELLNVVFFLIVFGVALIIGYLFSLAARFRANQTVKAMRRELESQVETIAALQRELDTYKPSGPEPSFEEPASSPAPQETGDANA